jgi:hypothetical protein
MDIEIPSFSIFDDYLCILVQSIFLIGPVVVIWYSIKFIIRRMTLWNRLRIVVRVIFGK